MSAAIRNQILHYFFINTAQLLPLITDTIVIHLAVWIISLVKSTTILTYLHIGVSKIFYLLILLLLDFMQS